MSGVSSSPSTMTSQDKAEITSLDQLGVGTTGQFITKTGADAYGYITGMTLADVQTVSGAKTFAGAVIISNPDTLTVGGKIVPQNVVITVPLVVTDVSKTVFTADTTYQVLSVQAVWGVAGGAGAVLSVEKLTGTTAPGSGTGMLTGNLDLTATANTNVSGTLSGTVTNLQLAVGDRLGVKLGGVLTGLVGAAVTITLKRI